MVLPITNNQQRTTVFLRGHHLLCIFGWQGDGYDQKFSQKMDDIVNKLKSGSTIEITLVADDICTACPNLKENNCHKDDRNQENEIRSQDKKVLNFLGLEPGKKLSNDDLKAIVSGRQAHLHLAKLCKDCSWLAKGYCYIRLSKLTKSSNHQAT